MVFAVRLTVIALLVVVLAFVYAEDVDVCYECEGEKMCKEQNTTKTTEPCKDSCLKVDNSKGVVVRKMCGTKDECDLYRYCYLCTTKECNSSSSISPSFVIMGIVGAIVAKYYM